MKCRRIHLSLSVLSPYCLRQHPYCLGHLRTLSAGLNTMSAVIRTVYATSVLSTRAFPYSLRTTYVIVSIECESTEGADGGGGSTERVQIVAEAVRREYRRWRMLHVYNTDLQLHGYPPISWSMQSLLKFGCGWLRMPAAESGLGRTYARIPRRQYGDSTHTVRILRKSPRMLYPQPSAASVRRCDWGVTPQSHLRADAADGCG